MKDIPRGFLEVRRAEAKRERRDDVCGCGALRSSHEDRFDWGHGANNSTNCRQFTWARKATEEEAWAGVNKSQFFHPPFSAQPATPEDRTLIEDIKGPAFIVESPLGHEDAYRVALALVRLANNTWGKNDAGPELYRFVEDQARARGAKAISLR